MSSTKTLDKPVVHLDDILGNFKLFGRYYVGFILMSMLLDVFDILMCTDYIFVTEKVSYRCLDERFGNDSCASLSNSSEVCTEWVYDNPHSFVAEFQLACQEWKRTLIGTTQSFGYALGLLFIGPLSDRLGRKTLIMSGAIVSMIVGVTKSFVTNYWCYVFMELLHAAFGNVYSAAYILRIEIVAHEKRVVTKIMCALGSSLGGGLLPLMAYLVPYWRHLLLVFYAPAIFLLSYIFLLDESPRWLLTKGKKDKAVVILKNIAKKSRFNLEEGALEHLTYVKNEENTSLRSSLKTTFSSGVLIKRFLVCLVWWTASTFICYGVAINSVSLPGNKYLNYGFISAAGIPALFTTMWVLKTFTRRSALIVSFFITAVLFLIQPFTPDGMQWLSVLFYFGGHFMTIIFFSVTYIFTSELFPTYTRNSMHALCSSLGRVGSIIAPQTPLLMEYWRGLPSLTFGAVSLLAGCVTLFAPKTASDKLPDTVKQAEAIMIPELEHFDSDKKMHKRNTHKTNEDKT